MVNSALFLVLFFLSSLVRGSTSQSSSGYFTCGSSSGYFTCDSCCDVNSDCYCDQTCQTDGPQPCSYQCASWGSTSLHVSNPAHNSECYWFRECSDHTKCLKLHFSSFDMETDYDYVYFGECPVTSFHNFSR